MDEPELWRAISEDDDGRALGDLFEMHADRVFRHAARLAHDIRDAEDATATAFLELWRRRQSVRLINGSPLPWLLATTTNSLRNLTRSSARYRRLIDTLPRNETAPSAEETALRDDGARSLLQALNPIDRQLITLVVLEGFSGEDAAKVLGLSPGAARTRLTRARGKLRNLDVTRTSGREELA